VGGGGAVIVARWNPDLVSTPLFLHLTCSLGQHTEFDCDNLRRNVTIIREHTNTIRDYRMKYHEVCFVTESGRNSLHDNDRTKMNQSKVRTGVPSSH